MTRAEGVRYGARWDRSTQVSSPITKHLLCREVKGAGFCARTNKVATGLREVLSTTAGGTSLPVTASYSTETARGSSGALVAHVIGVDTRHVGLPALFRG